MERIKNITKIARSAYCIGLAVMMLPQIIYKKFSGNFLPPWPGLPWVPFWASLFAIIIIAACVCIFLEIKGRTVSLLLGGLLLAMIILGGIPYELFIDPDHNHFISWASLLSGVAIMGGAFVVAGSFAKEPNEKRSHFIRLLEKLIPLGAPFFCITMIGYGLTHFIYPDLILSLYPDWIPFPIFWTYFAGVALILGGIAIVLRIKLKLAGILMGTLLLIFLLFIHVPLAIADPWGQNAFQSIRIFGALAFSGTAFLIALSWR
jgi:uncharacterized membrane protein